MAFFTKELQTTRFGKAFLVACNQQQIAIKELREKKIPLIVRRYMPDGW